MDLNTPLFTIAIVQSNADGEFHAMVTSLVDKKLVMLKAKNLSLLCKRVTKKINGRAAYNRKFPPPKPSVIIRPEEGSLIIPARN